MKRQELTKLSMNLEIFARMHIGQFARVLEKISEQKNESAEYEKTQMIEMEIKNLIFPEIKDSRTSYSISSEKVEEEGKIAWEMHSVIQHYLTCEADPEGWASNGFRKPMKITEEPLLKISKKEDEYVLENITKKKEQVIAYANEIVNHMIEKDVEPFSRYWNEKGRVHDSEDVQEWINIVGVENVSKE